MWIGIKVKFFYSQPCFIDKTVEKVEKYFVKGNKYIAEHGNSIEILIEFQY